MITGKTSEVRNLEFRQTFKLGGAVIAALLSVIAIPAQLPLPVDRPAASPSPSLALSLEAAKAALDACSESKVTAAVVDSSGELKAELASDGAPPLTVELALRKARTAATFKMPTSESKIKAKADIYFEYKLSSSLYSYYGGGVPLIAANGTLIGAVAVSGGSSEANDESCARAGANKIVSRLK
jgi:uncharacterized protein GlcG (DUF336 family)